MSIDGKPLDPPEKSLKYMAWSLKEIGAEFKKLNSTLQEISGKLGQKSPGDTNAVQDELPF